MLFDAHVALRKLEFGPVTPATTATTATKPAQTPPFVANVAVVAASRSQKSEKPLRTGEASPSGRGVGGGQLTWTAKVANHAEKSRPRLKMLGSGAKASIAAAVTPAKRKRPASAP